MTFRIGQRVACVTDLWDAMPGDPIPVKDEVYTIDSIHDHVDGCFVSLVEIGQPGCVIGGRGYGRFIFEAHAFRPLSDISIFTAMLDKAPTREVENVG